VNAEQNDPHPAPPDNARSRALRFYVAVAAVVLLSVGGYAIILSKENSGDRVAEQSASNASESTKATPPAPDQTPSSIDPARPPSTTPSSTNPPDPSNPLQIDGCGGPPYPKTFEGSTGNPDFTNATMVVYFNGPMISTTRLGTEVARVARLGCVSIPMNGASQPELNVVAWSNVGIFTKEQVVVALSRLGATAIATPACHPNCFK